MKKFVVALPLSLVSLSAAAFPNAPEYNGILGTAPITIMNSQNTQLQAELLTLQTGASNTPAGNWQVFGTGLANFVRTQRGNITQPGYRYNAQAFTVGTDYHFENGLYGLAFGRSMGTLTYASGNGSVMVDENIATLFGGYKKHHFYGSLIASLGNIDESNINHNVGLQTLTGETTGEQTDLNGTFGYNFRLLDNTLRTGPLVNADYQHINIRGFAETPNTAGVITTPVQYDRQTDNSLISGAGWQINYATQYNNTQLIPYLQTTYNHQFCNTQRNINVGMGVFSPSTTTAVPYSTVNENFLNVNAGVQAIFNSGLDLTFGYTTALGQKNVDAESVMISASMPVM